MARRLLPWVAAALLTPALTSAGQDRTPLRPLPPKSAPDRAIRGRITSDGSEAALEAMTLTLERSAGDSMGNHTNPFTREVDFQNFEWVPVGPIELEDDLTFSAAAPADAPFLRFVAAGRFALGIHRMQVDGVGDPGDAPLELRLHTGGEVVLELRPEASAQPDKIESLIGGELAATASGKNSLFGPKNWPDGDRTSLWPGQVERSGTIDERLRIVLPRLPIDSFTLNPWPTVDGQAADSVLGPFHAPGGFRFRPRAGLSTRVVVPLRRGVRFEARVLGPEGEPLEGATADLEISAAGPGSSFYIRRITGPDGRIEVSGLADRPRTVKVYAHPFLPRSFSGPALGDAGRSVDLTIRASPTLEVRVTTQDGAPAAGLPLTVLDPRSRESSTVTDVEGRATFKHLSGAPVEVIAVGALSEKVREQSAAGSPPPVHFVRSRGTDLSLDPTYGRPLWVAHAKGHSNFGEPLELVLVPAVKVHGTVLGIDPDRGPTSLHVTRGDLEKESFGLRNHRAAWMTLPDGSTAFTLQIPPGRFQVAAVQGDFDAKVLDLARVGATPHASVEIGQDEAPPHLSLAFGARAPIKGTLRTKDGTPLPGVEVTFQTAFRHGPHANTTTTSDAEGAFASPPLLAGRYQVRAHQADPPLWAFHPVIDFDPEQPEPIELVADLSGWVDIKSSDPSRAIRISYRNPVSYSNPLAAIGTSEHRVGPLAHDAVFLGLETVHTDGSLTIDGQVVPIQPGTTAACQLGTGPAITSTQANTLTGKVTSGSAPQAGLRVIAIQDGFKTAWCDTDTDGSYRLILPSNSAVTLAVEDGGFKEVARREPRRGSGSSAPWDLELPTGSISIARAEGSSVRLRRLDPPDGSPPPRDRHLQHGRLDFFFVEDGRYEVARLAAGRHVLQRAEVVIEGGQPVHEVEFTAVPR